VRYVMEGSVQREGKRARITAQFIDALTGHHLFSERYDLYFKDIFTLQDKITLRVLTALNMKLFFGIEAKDLIGKGPKNLEAGIKLTQPSRYLFGALNKERLEKARQLIDEAIALDPNYASAYSDLCLYSQAKIVISACESPEEDLLRALALGKKTVTLDDSSPAAHTTLSSVYTFLGEHDKATAEAE
jgi:adenylate cyclase